MKESVMVSIVRDKKIIIIIIILNLRTKNKSNSNFRDKNNIFPKINYYIFLV